MVGPTFSWYLSSAHATSGSSGVTWGGVCQFGIRACIRVHGFALYMHTF